MQTLRKTVSGRARGLLVVALGALALSMTSAGAVNQWDQRNDGVPALWLEITGSAAQTFTPSLSSVDTVQLCFTSEAGGDIAVKILDSSGNAIGTSSTYAVIESPAPWPASIPPNQVGTFAFSPPVALTPGATYTIQTVNVSGYAYAYHAPLDPTHPFGSGAGLWYREGVTGIDPTNPAATVGSPVC